jgi:hypothetical protein
VRRRGALVLSRPTAVLASGRAESLEAAVEGNRDRPLFSQPESSPGEPGSWSASQRRTVSPPACEICSGAEGERAVGTERIVIEIGLA